MEVSAGAVSGVLMQAVVVMAVILGCILIGVTMPRVCDRLFDWHNMRQNRKLMDKAPLPPTQLDYESVRNAKDAATLVAQYKFEADEYRALTNRLQARLDAVYIDHQSLCNKVRVLEAELAQERENYDKLKPMVVPMRKEIDLFLGEP